MNLRVALIADDLTGALDTATPFVLCGLAVSVAVAPEHVAAALATGADVVAVSTNSRADRPGEAAAEAGRAAAMLRASRPGIIFKKIDSRLKGNVAAETAAVAAAFGLGRALACPAVPDQGRRVAGGRLSGTGVPEPMSVAEAFAGSGLDVEVADAADDLDLDRLVADADMTAGRLMVGARGLGAAFARRLGRPTRPTPYPAAAETLYAIGSRDPITEAQVERLLARDPPVACFDAPAGDLPPPPPTVPLPAVLRCTGERSADPVEVAARFGEHAAAWLAAARPATLMFGGGDTALAVLARIGAGVLSPLGEVVPGMPWMTVRLADGRSLTCVLKSGGFGKPDALTALLPRKSAEKRSGRLAPAGTEL